MLNNKYKKMKTKINRFLAKTIPVVLLIMLTSSTSLAHAPEYHLIPENQVPEQFRESRNECRNLTSENWDNNGIRVPSEECDPNNLPDLSRGISKDQFPNGLCVPSFNNYTDLVNRDGTGRDPFRTPGALFGNERDFLKIAKDNGGDLNFINTVTMAPGERVQVVMYIHNDGDTCLNDNVFENGLVDANNFPANWRTTSHNTRVDFKPGFRLVNGVPQITINAGTDFNAGIQSDDAISENNQRGGKTTDKVRINLANGTNELILNYVPGSAKYVDFNNAAGQEWAPDIHDIPNPNGFFTGTMPLPTLENGAVKAGGGDYYASEPYIGLISFDLEAEEPEEEIPNICTELAASQIGESIVLDNDQTFSAIRVDSLNFHENIPANARIRWTSSNPNAQWFTGAGFFRNEPLGEGTVITDANDFGVRALFHTGNGGETITLEVIPENLDPDNECEAEVTTEAPVVCREIVVNHNEPIVEGFVSRMSAQSYDQNGDEYEGGGIRYMVDDGYGWFTEDQPDEPPLSSAPYLNNLELRSAQNVFRGQRPAWMAEVFDQSGAFNSENWAQAYQGIESENPQLPPGADYRRQFDFNQIPVPRVPDFRQNSVLGANSFFPQAQNPKQDPNNPFAAAAAQAGAGGAGAGAAQAAAANGAAMQPRLNIIQDLIEAFNNNEFGLLTIDAASAAEVFLTAVQGSDGEEVVWVEQLDEDGNPIPECSAHFPIEPLVCEAIDVTITSLDGDEVEGNAVTSNGIYSILVQSQFGPIDERGRSTIIHEINPEYGVFVQLFNPGLRTIRDAQANGTNFNQATLRQFISDQGGDPNTFILGNRVETDNPSLVRFITFGDTPAINDPNFIQITTTDNGELEPACSANIAMEVDIREPVCLELTSNLRNVEDFGTALEEIERNNVYTITASSEFGIAQPQEDRVVYSVEDGYGVFIRIEEIPLAMRNPLVNAIRVAQSNSNIVMSTRIVQMAVAAINRNPQQIVANPLEVDPGEIVVLVTFPGTPEFDGPEVQITQLGFEAQCNDQIDMNPEPVCRNLNYEIGGEQSPASLERNTIQGIRAESQYQNDVNPDSNTITYEIDPAYGALIDNRALAGVLENQAAAGNDLTQEFVNQWVLNIGMDPVAELKSTLTVESGDAFWVLIYSDGPAAAGEEILTIAADNNDEQGICSASVGTPEIPGLFCEELGETILNAQDLAVESIDRGQFYTISSTPNIEAQITYEVDEDYGTFITFFPASQRIKDLYNRGQMELTREQLIARLNEIGIDENSLSQSVTVNEGDNVYLVVYADAPNAAIAGALTINTVGLDGNCSASYDIDERIEEEPLACIELFPFIDRIVGAEQLNAPIASEPAVTIERNSIYQVTAKSAFLNNIEPIPNEVTYTIDPRYGTIINPNHPALQNNNVLDRLIRAVAILQDQRALNANSLNAAINLIFGDNINATTNELTIQAGEQFLVITYTDAPVAAEIFSIKQTGDAAVVQGLENCIAEIPIPINTICVDLQANPRGGAFNPENATTVFDITGQFQGHNGPITVTLDGQGSLSRVGEAIDPARNSITFPEREVNVSNVLIFVYHKAANYNPDQPVNIRVNATGDPRLPAGVCTANISTVVVPRASECISLNITRPVAPWRVDVTGDNQLFQIDVNTRPAARTNEFFYNWEVTREQGEWDRNREALLHRQGDLEQTLRNFDDNTRVRVWASRDAAGNDIFKDANGNQICVDTINARGADRPEPPDRETPPEIEKVVYPNKDLARANKMINIADKTKETFVTFMAVFTPGSETKSVAIQDESLTTGGDIISTGGLGGHLDLQAIEIIAIDNYNNSDGKIIYRSSPAYQSDNTNNRLSDNNYSYSNENYDCSVRGNKICIDDVIHTYEKFRAGGEIGFDNVNDLGPEGRIVIKYQMRNQSKITPRSCENLTALDGCGEKFRNVIQYRAFNEKNFEGDGDDRGDDSAEAIVLCPFVLTRQGGDVLFHDIINSGADVAQCSPVKGSTGVGIRITPVPRTPEEIAGRTGDGELQEAQTLTRPSHDVCRFSNEENNLENYNDALKNFSSTVCELQAEVAEDLYETNINAAIRANITRIARWGQNLTLNTVNSVNDLNQIDNKESGVFVRTDGNLTIGAGGTFTIQGKQDGTIPAAQTYIVIGHNLIINSDIIAAAPNYLDPRNIAYASFIVIDGNIIIDKDVKQLDGIYMAINLTKDGEIRSSAESDTRLKVNGSMIGNVFHLFKNRIAIGDPRFDQGAVTIQYDERILLNTPPGIGELIDLKQAVVPQ